MDLAPNLDVGAEIAAKEQGWTGCRVIRDREAPGSSPWPPTKPPLADDVHVDRHRLAPGEQIWNLGWRDGD
jgi:hypothetical protein